MEIRKVWKNKGNGQLLISIPRINFKEGDYIAIKKINLDDKSLFNSKDLFKILPQKKYKQQK